MLDDLCSEPYYTIPCMRQEIYFLIRPTFDGDDLGNVCGHFLFDLAATLTALIHVYIYLYMKKIPLVILLCIVQP